MAKSEFQAALDRKTRALEEALSMIEDMIANMDYTPDYQKGQMQQDLNRLQRIRLISAGGKVK